MDEAEKGAYALVRLRIDWPEDGPTLFDVHPHGIEWFEIEMETLGICDALESMLHVRRDWATWMLENGIAPGQEFLARVSKPTVHHYTTEWDWESDITYGAWEILERAPLSPATTAAAWAGWLADPGYGRLLI